MTEAMRAAVGVIVTREARLEDALRHARGIVAAEVQDRRALICATYHFSDWAAVEVYLGRRAAWPGQRHTPRPLQLLRDVAELDEWETGIAAWDAALAPEAVIVESGQVIGSAEELAAFVAQGVPRRDPDPRD